MPKARGGAKARDDSDGDSDGCAPGGGAAAAAGLPRPQDAARSFHRIVRVFASALYFGELVKVLGPQKNLKERAEHRTFAMFLLALWHAEQPAAPSELVQHRAKADKRKRNEVDWLSPTGDKKQLCPYTGIARGMNVALNLPAARAFTADELKSVGVGFNSVQGCHTGIHKVDRDSLLALLASKQLTEEQFTAAMFTNVLTPERFTLLQEHLAETRALKGAAKKSMPKKPAEKGKTVVAGDDDSSDSDAEPPAAKPKPAVRGKAAPARPAEAKPAPKRASARGSTRTPPAPPARGGLAPAPSSGTAAAIAAFLQDSEQRVVAGFQELTGLFSGYAKTCPEIEKDGVEAMAVLTKSVGLNVFSGGLAAAPSWQPQASSGGLAPAGSVGAQRSLSAAPSLEGMMIAQRNMEASAAALENDADTALLLEAAAAVPTESGGLAPAMSARTFASGGSWIPATLAAAPSVDGFGLRPASSVGAVAYAQLARANSLQPVPSAEARAAVCAEHDILADARPRLNLFEGLLQSDSFLDSFAEARRHRRAAAAASAAAPPPPTFAQAETRAMLDGALGEGTVANTERAFAAPPGTPMGPEEMAHTVKLLERLFSNGLPGVEATWMRS